MRSKQAQKVQKPLSSALKDLDLDKITHFDLLQCLSHLHKLMEKRGSAQRKKLSLTKFLDFKNLNSGNLGW